MEPFVYPSEYVAIEVIVLNKVPYLLKVAEVIAVVSDLVTKVHVVHLNALFLDQPSIKSDFSKANGVPKFLGEVARVLEDPVGARVDVVKRAREKFENLRI